MLKFTDRELKKLAPAPGRKDRLVLIGPQWVVRGEC